MTTFNRLFTATTILAALALSACGLEPPTPGQTYNAKGTTPQGSAAVGCEDLNTIPGADATWTFNWETGGVTCLETGRDTNGNWCSGSTPGTKHSATAQVAFKWTPAVSRVNGAYLVDANGVQIYNCEAAISKITYTTPEAEASKVLMATGLATYGVINKDDLAQVYFRSMGVVGTAPLAK